MTPEIYIDLIREFITDGETQQALDELKKMADQLNVGALMTEHALLSAQFQNIRRDYGRGTITLIDLNLVVNKINDSILSLLEQFQSGELMEPIGDRGNEKGRIVHNIPSRMKPHEPTLCSVRIAKDDTILLENFPVSDISEPESLAISRTMTVELVDPMGGEVFQIRRITPEAEQRIDRDSFTEWDFAITPLKQGKYTLWLYATTVVDGANKALKFSKSIDISTEEINQPKTWESTQILVQQPEKQSMLPPVMPRRSKGGVVPKIIMGALTIAVIGTVALFYSRPLTQSKPPTQVVQPLLAIDRQLQILSVELDGTTIDNWTLNADSTTITLPLQETGRTYLFVVKGKNGNCEKQHTLTKDSLIISMDCKIIHEKPEDDEGVDNDPVEPPLFELKLRVRRDSLGDVDLSKLRVSSEKLRRDLTPTPEGDYLVFRASNLKADTYSFILKDYGSQAICTALHKTVNRNLTLDFECKSATHFSVTLKVPKEAAPQGNYRPLRIKINRIVQNNRPRIEGDFAIFHFPKLPRGRTTFEVVNGAMEYPCSSIKEEIDKPKTLEIECRSIIH